jgi:hypothetical protein
MQSNVVLPRFRRGLASLLVGAAIFLPAASGSLYAQEGVKVFFWPRAKPPATPDEGISAFLALRPNVEQEFFLFVNNPGDEIKGPVTVELRAGGKPVPGIASKPSPLAKGMQKVQFAPAAPAAPGAKPAPPTELKGAIEVVLLDNGKPIGNRIRVLPARPSSYVVVSSPQFDPEARTLEVTVAGGKDFSGPPCHVELELRPDRIPFLAPKQTQDGTYAADVNGPADQKTLQATNLQLGPQKELGLVYLTVDGYRRAFTFRVTNNKGQLTPIQGPIIRLLTDTAVASSATSTFGVEADNVPLDAKIEMGLFREDGKRDLDLLEFTGPRRTQFFLGPQGPEGGLVFSTKTADWTDEKLDTSKVGGKRILRVRLLSKSGEEMKFTQASRGTELKEEERITQSLVFDRTPPEDVKFVDLPKEAERGLTLKVKAAGRDPESDIRGVLFFVGKLTKEGAIPPEAVQKPGEKTKEKDVWSADIEVPADKAVAALDLGVQFTNNAGMPSKPVVATVKLVDAKPGAATIKGEVVEGDRIQRGLKVELRDEKGAKKDTTETDGQGKFVFKNVTPARYQIVVLKSANLWGAAEVTVAENEVKVLKDPIKVTRH